MQKWGIKFGDLPANSEIINYEESYFNIASMSSSMIANPPFLFCMNDNCFIGSRSIVVEGVRIEKEAVLGANVVITKSTKIIDVTGSTPVEMRGIVPSRSVVIPGSYPKNFPAGEFQVPCALIIGKRKPSTDVKTSLNEALRDYEVAV
jgi:2,3,4,5-tetrahydropyridine-2-carboxylate N-succinyltransferase